MWDDLYEVCSSDKADYDCLHRKGAKLRYLWSYESKDSVELELRVKDRFTTEIHLSYKLARKRKKGAAEPAAGASEAAEGEPAGEEKPSAVPGGKAPPGLVCAPGRSIACVGRKACNGYQVCRDDGAGYGACVCD